MLQSLFNKVASLQDCNFIKRYSNAGFSVKFAKFLRTLILKKICEQLFLTIMICFSYYTKIFIKDKNKFLHSVHLMFENSFQFFLFGENNS